MFSKSKPSPRPQAEPVPIPDLPDLPSPSQKKQGATTAAAAPQPAPQARPAQSSSTLASGLSFNGDLSGNGQVTIEGSVTGDVRVSHLVIGETGSVEGSVSADVVEVRGRIVGAVNGKQVKLFATAYVDGDISHEQLSIDVGAYFQGRCLQARKDAPQPAQSAQPVGFAPPRPAEAPQSDDGAQLISLKPSA